jgi:hypothetical protein
MLRRIVIGAAALAAALASHAGEVTKRDELTYTISFCDDTSAQLVIESSTPKLAIEVGKALERATKPLCAVGGPIAGAWLLEGSQQAFKVGVIPVGSASGLLVTSAPHTLVSPLTVRVEHVKQ